MERENMPQTEKYLSSVLEDLVHLIRFPLMDKDEFYIKVLRGQMQILTSDEREEMRDYFSLNQFRRSRFLVVIFCLYNSHSVLSGAWPIPFI